MIQGSTTGVGKSSRRRWRAFMFIVSITVSGLLMPAVAHAFAPPIVPVQDAGGGATMPAALQNEQVVLRLFDDVFTRKLPDVCALLMSASAKIHTPAGEYEGPAGFEQFVAEAWAVLPNAAFAIEDGFANGDSMTVQWSMNGTSIAGLAPSLDGIAIMRFENHMIAEAWIVYDRLHVQEQLEDARFQRNHRNCPPCLMP
jgi:predicted ester cyclase